jgi:hypothetical protein
MNSLSALSDFQRLHGEKEPSKQQDKQLYFWLARMRWEAQSRWRNGGLDNRWIAHVVSLRCLGIDILRPKRGMSKNKASFKFWKPVVKSFEKQRPETKEQLAGLIDFLKGYTKDDLGNRFTSVTDYTLQKLKVGDIHPLDCKRSSPQYSIFHTLSYFIDPIIPSHTQVEPSWVSDTRGKSVYFEASNLFTDELYLIYEKFEAQLPSFLFEIHSKNKTFQDQVEAKKWIIAQTSNDAGKWFGRLRISLYGTNPAGGAEDINLTSNPGPR